MPAERTIYHTPASRGQQVEARRRKPYHGDRKVNVPRLLDQTKALRRKLAGGNSPE